MSLPLVLGTPGGTELLLIGLVSAVLFSPLLAAVYVVLFRDRIAGDEDRDARLADLEAEVEALRAQLDDRDDGGDRLGDDGGDRPRDGDGNGG